MGDACCACGRVVEGRDREGRHGLRMRWDLGGEEKERLRLRGSGGGVDGNGMERRSRGVSGAEGGGQPRV